MTETITIERMGYGAEAVGHLSDGKTVFVEGGAPGDVASVEVVEDKPTFARARIAKLEQPGACRVMPKWAEPAASGAAPWQHIAYDAQLEAKRANVVAALARTGGFGDAAAELVAPCLPSKRQWGYRNKLELGAQWDAKGTFNLGFHQEGSPDVMQALSCPLAHDAIAKAPKALRGALRYLQGSDDLGIFRVGVRTSVRTRETEIALWTRPSGFPRAAAAKMLKSSLKATSVVRVIADPGKARKIKGLEVLDGKGCWQEQLLGARYVAHAPSFFQVNTAQAEKLMEQAIRMLGGKRGGGRPRGARRVARRRPVRGLRHVRRGHGARWRRCDRRGVRRRHRCATCAATPTRTTSTSTSIGGDAARELPELGGLDALVVDPPRAGPCRRRARQTSPPPARGAWSTSAATPPLGRATCAASRTWVIASSACSPWTCSRRPTTWSWSAASSRLSANAVAPGPGGRCPRSAAKPGARGLQVAGPWRKGGRLARAEGCWARGCGWKAAGPRVRTECGVAA